MAGSRDVSIVIVEYERAVRCHHILHVFVSATFSCLIQSSRVGGLALPGLMTVSRSVSMPTTPLSSLLWTRIGAYELGSGAGLNVAKSLGLFLGSCKTRFDSALGLQWTCGNLSLLGILIRTNQDCLKRTGKLAVNEVNASL